LAWAVACTKHQTWLLDQCLRCGCPLMFHRTSIRQAARALCACCRGNLASLETKPADAEVLAFQRQIEDGLLAGDVPVAGRVVPSLDFFRGLRQFARCVYQTRGRGLVDAFDDIAKPSIPKVRFEHWGAAQRQVLMLVLARCMQSWPHKMRDLMASVRLNPSQLTTDLRERPADWVLDDLGIRRPLPRSRNSLAFRWYGAN
jgi:hypothetical protein